VGTKLDIHNIQVT